jgi:hypothetical protein
MGDRLSEGFAGLPSCIGAAIESLYLNDEGVPTFVPVVCGYIARHRHVVGLFRLCGRHKLVQELGIFLNLPCVSLPPSGGVHDATSFLKLWLRSLPVPVITPAIANKFFVQGDPASVAQVLKNLSPINRKTLAAIFAMMDVVIKQANVNQMSFGNMMICFTTSLLQNNRGLAPGFRFSEFFQKAVELLNPARNDFVI